MTTKPPEALNPLERIRELSRALIAVDCISPKLNPIQAIRECGNSITEILNASDGWLCVPVAEYSALSIFANGMLEDFPNIGADGGDVQDLAAKAGLLKPEIRTESCGDGCQCADEADFPMECFRFTAALNNAIATASKESQ